MENLLSADEGVLRALFDATTLGILVVDAQGTVVLANPYCQRLFGYAPEALVGQPLEQLLPPRVREEHVGLRKAFFGDPQVRPMGTGRRLHGQRCCNYKRPRCERCVVRSYCRYAADAR